MKAQSQTVRPRAARLLTYVECSRIKDNSWLMPYPIVTTRTEVELVE